MQIRPVIYFNLPKHMYKWKEGYFRSSSYKSCGHSSSGFLANFCSKSRRWIQSSYQSKITNKCVCIVHCKLSKSYLIDTNPVGTISIVPTGLVRQGRTLAITQIRISDDLLKVVLIRIAADSNRILANIPGFVPTPPTSMTTSSSTTTTASTTTSSTRNCDRHRQE